MDLKLIEKLARLANNNPNEHEANAAARKVCKLLEESNFNFNNTRVFDITDGPQWNQTNPFDNIKDIINDLNRVRYNSPFSGPYYTDPFDKGRKRSSEDEWKNRTCAKCGKTEYTRRITNVFRCDACEFKAQTTEPGPKW